VSAVGSYPVCSKVIKKKSCWAGKSAVGVLFCFWRGGGGGGGGGVYGVLCIINAVFLVLMLQT